MRVIYFHQHFSTPAGATGTRSYAMARRLIEHGHQVTMVCGSYSVGNTGLTGRFENGVRRGFVDGIHVLEFDLKYSNSDGFWKRVLIFLRFVAGSIRLVFRTEYDLVFATSTPLTASIPGIFAKVIRRKPFVFEVRDLWPELPRAMGVITNPVILALMSWLERCSYRAADSCIGLSPGIVKGITARGKPPSQVHMIPNGSDLEIFADNLKAQPWRPDDVLDDDLLLVFAGTMGVANGLDSVIRIAEELSRRRCDGIKFVFAGEGKKKTELAVRVRESNLKNCLFLDPMAKTRLAGLLRGADLGLMVLANVPAFYYGTSPNKFFDYIAAGLPVFNNYPGWLADMIREHECGLVLPPDDAIAGADALQRISQERDSLTSMGENAIRLARQEFSRPVLADRFVSVLETTFQETFQ